MVASILDTIKQMLGIAVEDDNFDNELIVHINSAISVLTQLGVGPVEGYRIEDATQEWPDLLADRKDIDNVKSAVYCRVRLAFDPPQNTFLVEALNKQRDEAEWRIEVAVDPVT